MNELAMNFRFETAEVRTMLINNEPWFVGVDVALALGYSNPRDALAKHVDPEDKGVAKCDTPGVDFIDTSSNGVTQRKIC